ncbi:B3 domain-containing transcription repressor VAL2-like isoform X3 [Olea europaea var. sylvestris]|uniref:B3 domain-containing transcription repressor VAL2-like isoform X3 n=1 Tax=Olea europaea var. sylvestris TaxID=158386 RepID=UPI000C1D4798|nr:B3 domain-containing transcription repressor VAL2-like isoform X3 [Olea europaea var. sylvestris]
MMHGHSYLCYVSLSNTCRAVSVVILLEHSLTCNSSAYEDGKFCETFHLKASGWSCCNSCGKHIHCGCIVSFHMFILLDAGGIECLTCAKKSYILTPNPAWPPPSQFLPSQHRNLKDLSMKSWRIAGSGPLPWRKAPSFFNDSGFQFELQPGMPVEVDVVHGIDRFGISERFSISSLEKKQENFFERLIDGKPIVGPSETLEDGISASNREEQHNPSVASVVKNESSTSNVSLASAFSSKHETNGLNHDCASLSQWPTLSTPMVKHVPRYNGMNSAGEAVAHTGKARGDCRGRNQLLPWHWPQITNEELLQLSSNSNSVLTPLFEKILTASDAGRIGRLVLPKKCAEAYFPLISQPEGLPLEVLDLKGKEWVFQFRFWPNNNSRMYVLEGITPCIQSMQLQAGDVVTFSRLEPEGKLVMGGRKASTTPSNQGVEATLTGNDALAPEDDKGKYKLGEINSINGLTKGNSVPARSFPVNQIAKADSGTTWSEICKSRFKVNETLEAKAICHGKRKNSILGSKGKRLRVENEDMIELKITWNQAQGLMRPSPKIVPTVIVVEDFEIEEFEQHAPIIGRPTIPAIDHFGEKIQWVQCDDCLKWRKVPANALLPSRWTCSENVWGLDRSLCLAAEKLSTEELEDMIPTISKDSCKKKKNEKQESDSVVAMEGLNALANLAIQGEEDLPASSLSGLRHPRHKLGCTCIVCIQPPSGKGPRHAQTCDCVVCKSLKRRCKTLRDRREKKQLEKEAETTYTEQVPDNDSCVDDASERNFLVSPLKGQIDLNIQPERDEEVSPGLYFGAIKCSLPDATEGNFRQQGYSSLGVGINVVDKQIQEDGTGQSNFSNRVTLDSHLEKTDVDHHLILPMDTVGSSSSTATRGTLSRQCNH